MRTLPLLCTLATLTVACKRAPGTYEFPKPVDTTPREVRLLPDTLFTTPSGVRARTDFPGARLARFAEAGPDTFAAEIPAENEPINPSPWYAFELSAPVEREVVIHMVYPPDAAYRYFPKTAPSRSGPWTVLPASAVDTSANTADVRVTVGPEGLFLAAQELIATDSIRRWIIDMAVAQPALSVDTIGQSRLFRSLWKLELSDGPEDERPTFLFFSRQHPPEVTGFQAFQAFFARLLEGDELAARFRKTYRVLAFPVVNPDGVDEGHWRHTAGGVDPNRDWAVYNQTETKAIVEWLQAHTERDQVVWGMDFHSTQYDVFYTHDPERVKFRRAEWQEAWLRSLAAWAAENYPNASALPARERNGRPIVVGQDTLRIEPEALGRPTSSGWVAQHYKAVAITYEVGDEQDRAYIAAKARAAAEAMMEVALRGGTAKGS